MIKSMIRSAINNRVDYRSMLAGNEYYSPGAYELISTAFGTGASGTITFSSIPQTYKHLQIRWTAKTDGTTSSKDTALTFNGITTSVYSTHALTGNQTSVTSNATAAGTSITITNANEPSVGSAYATGLLDVLDYASSVKNKTVRALYGSAGNTTAIYLRSGLYNQTTAISSLTLALPGGSGANFQTPSRFSLYGIKG